LSGARKPPSLQDFELELSSLSPSLLFGIAEGSLLPIIPASAGALGADLPTAAVITGLVMVGTLVADIPAAKLINRIGERNAMLTASAVGSLGVLFSLFSSTLWMLGAGMFLLGASVSVFALARHSFLTEAVPYSHRARSLSILGGVFRAGHFIGPMIGALLITLFDIQAVFWSAAVFAALAAIVLLFVKPDVMPDTPGITKGATWMVAKKGIKETRDSWRGLCNYGKPSNRSNSWTSTLGPSHRSISSSYRFLYRNSGSAGPRPFIYLRTDNGSLRAKVVSAPNTARAFTQFCPSHGH
jgi:Arabinose efflux permease